MTAAWLSLGISQIQSVLGMLSEVKYIRLTINRYPDYIFNGTQFIMLWLVHKTGCQLDFVKK